MYQCLKKKKKICELYLGTLPSGTETSRNLDEWDAGPDLSFPGPSNTSTSLGIPGTAELRGPTGHINRMWTNAGNTRTGMNHTAFPRKHRSGATACKPEFSGRNFQVA